MSDWKVLYRDDLDRDRTSWSIPSKEAAVGIHLEVRNRRWALGKAI